MSVIFDFCIGGCILAGLISASLLVRQLCWIRRKRQRNRELSDENGSLESLLEPLRFETTRFTSETDRRLLRIILQTSKSRGRPNRSEKAPL